jgi:NADH-quinone oxidoreductase subunit L
VSQLGYMFLAAGLGAYGAAIFHLMTHAFFKALLFLGSGSVIHAMGGEQDMRKMGGLARHLPITRWTFWIGCVAISGIPVFSGFFSKDEILAAAAGSGHWLLWGIGFLTAGLTACYMFRAYRLTFLGEFRGSEEQRHHLHESPPVMTAPLVILAAGAVGAGWVGIPAVLGEPLFGRDVNWLHHLLEPVVAAHPAGFLAGAHHLSHGLEIGLMLLSVAVAAAGIWLASRLFRSPEPLAGDARIAGALGAFYRLLADKYRIDELYDRVVVRPLAALARAFWKAVDGFVIDGLLHASAFVTELTGDLGRFTTTGNARHYVLYFLVGLIVLFWWVVS